MDNYNYLYVPINSNLILRDTVLEEGFTNQTIHVHHNDELGIYENDGTCQVVNNGHVYTVQTPAIIWNRAGAFHQLTKVDSGNLHYYGIDYNSKLYAKLPKELVHTSLLEGFDFVALPLTEAQVAELKPLLLSMKPKTLPQKEKLMLLLCILHKLERWSQDSDRVVRSNITPHYVFQLAYQLQDLSKPMGNIEELAQQFFVGQTKLKADFKKVFGVPILAYRRRVQLQTAKALLETDNSEIAQIATECGFQDESYFIQVFRKFYGITPAAYRRQKRKS